MDLKRQNGLHSLVRPGSGFSGAVPRRHSSQSQEMELHSGSKSASPRKRAEKLTSVGTPGVSTSGRGLHPCNLQSGCFSTQLRSGSWCWRGGGQAVLVRWIGASDEPRTHRYKKGYQRGVAFFMYFFRSTVALVDLLTKSWTFVAVVLIPRLHWRQL